MPKKVRSAKGAIVDFDLIKIKEQIANSVPPADVKAREDFVDRRLRRRLRRSTVRPPAPKLPSKTVEVNPTIPGTNKVQSEMIEEKDAPAKKEPNVKEKAAARTPSGRKKAAATKQKARKT